MLLNYEQTDEVAQEVFVRAYMNLGQFKKDSSFLTWIYRIAINLTRNRLKKNSRLRGKIVLLSNINKEYSAASEYEISDRKTMPDKQLLAEEKKAIIEKAINELKDDFKIAVVLRDVQDLSYEEIADILK